MYVIGHDHPFVQFDVWEMIGNLQPAGGGGAACIIQNHPAPYDGSEQVTPILRANGDEIGARLGIIIAA
jgi:hypothetical protein